MKQYEFTGWINSRRVVDSKEYQEHCLKLWDDIHNEISFEAGSSVLVIGTEEFMYPALFIGSCIEKSDAGLEVIRQREVLLKFVGLRILIHILFTKDMSCAAYMMIKERLLFMIWIRMIRC